MTYKHSGALGVVILAVVGAPLTYALDLPLVAILLATVPGAIAACVSIDLHRRARDRHVDQVERQRTADRRLRALQRISAQRNEQLDTMADRVESHRANDECWHTEVGKRLEVVQKLVKQPPLARADAVTQQDLLGSLEVLQAGYEGRLDRAQSALEEATRAIRAGKDLGNEDPAPQSQASDARHVE